MSGLVLRTILNERPGAAHQHGSANSRCGANFPNSPVGARSASTNLWEHKPVGARGASTKISESSKFLYPKYQLASEKYLIFHSIFTATPPQKIEKIGDRGSNLVLK